ncbi:luciferin 4-monooxygenase-like [Oppia nitens]|uniref:luciferin 4-monooxygenase-like n=1 Tax=Oppia nitens TaxID=1686743 RepID=UPI0023DC3CB3|nr:luciferin 4-monooxygenase-like [Oppia nitens]
MKLQKMYEHIVDSNLCVENKLNYQSVIDLIIDRLHTNSDDNLFIDCTLNRKWTKKQVLDSSLNFAYYLINDCKLAKGEIICFVTQNSDIHAIGIIGSLAAGLVYCCQPHHSTESEIRDNVSKIKPSVLVCYEQNVEQVINIANSFPFVKKILMTDKPQDNSEHNIDFPISLENIFTIERDYQFKLPVNSQLTETATFVLSSGSTGQPKAIIKTNKNLLSTVEALAHREISKLTPNDIMLSSNFCHISGQRCLLSTIDGNAQLAIIRVDEDLEDVYHNIHKYNITTAFLIPTQLNYLAKHCDTIDKNYLKSLKDVVTGAASLSETTYRCIVDKFAFEKFRICYGMSEVGWVTQTPLCEIKNVDNNCIVGKVVPNTQIKIIDENGKSLPANTSGQICIGGEQVTPGYLENKEENEKLFTADGYLKSGDIGYYDDNHFIYIVGRIKDVINVERVIVRPAELESILLSHRDVMNTAVIGVKDEERIEVPMAFVTVVNGSQVTPKELIDYVDSRVNYYKKLRGGLKILEAFPMTSLKKINKSELRRLYT